MNLRIIGLGRLVGSNRFRRLGHRINAAGTPDAIISADDNQLDKVREIVKQYPDVPLFLYVENSEQDFGELIEQAAEIWATDTNTAKELEDRLLQTRTVYPISRNRGAPSKIVKRLELYFMGKVYARNQAKVLFPYWPDKVDWFVVGGVANGNEAQTIHEKYPDVKCVGFEPNPVMRENAAPNFPGTTYPYALWETNGSMNLVVPNHRDISSSLCRDFVKQDQHEKHNVPTYTLDTLSEELGPFTNSVLWIDIEWAELPALKGATNLLTNHIQLINLEVMTVQQRKEITKYLAGFGFKEVHRWGHGNWGNFQKWDLVFKK